MKTLMERAGLWGGVFVVVILALVLVIVSLIQIDKQDDSSCLIENSSDSHQDWLIENCKCIEYNGTISCMSGFALNGTWCRDENNRISPRLIGCSKYKCPEIVEVKR